MLSHTFSYGSEKEGALTGAIFSHIKWTFRFSDKLRITTLLQASTFPFPTANTQWQDFLATVPLAWTTQETHKEALLGQPALVHCPEKT